MTSYRHGLYSTQLMPKVLERRCGIDMVQEAACVQFWRARFAECTLKKSAVVTGTSSGRSDLSKSPSFTSSSKLIISVLPHRASRPEYGDQNTSSGGTSGST